jgi:hypothetical protein
MIVALFHREREAQRPGRRRIILISSVLPAEHNVGYQNLRDTPVERVNGKAIDSLAEVAAAFAQPEGRFHVVTLVPNPVRREIVLDAERFEAWNAEILKRYGVPAQARLPETPPPDPGPTCPGDF